MKLCLPFLWIVNGQYEQEWQIRFTKTTNDQWDFMAEMLRQEIANNRTASIKKVFPS
jgi:hypothetical protein